MSARLKRRLGLLLTITSTVLLIPSMLIVMAPIISHVLFNGYYWITADIRALQEISATSMLGGAGFVGGLWLTHSGRNQN